MRILSKFKDYYDGVANAGERDPRDRVYVRHTTEIQEPPFIATGERGVLGCIGERFIPGWYNNRQLQHIRIGFCGKLYPVIAYQDTYMYSYEDVLRFVQSFDIREMLKHFQNFKLARPSRTSEQLLREHFTPGTFLQPFLDHDTPIIVVEEIQYPRWNRKYTCNKDANLLNYNFAKVFPPYQAYQELDMFLHAHLLEHPRPMVQIADKHLIAAKGFDLKTSFRKPKES